MLWTPCLCGQHKKRLKRRCMTKTLSWNPAMHRSDIDSEDSPNKVSVNSHQKECHKSSAEREPKTHLPWALPPSPTGRTQHLSLSSVVQVAPSHPMVAASAAKFMLLPAQMSDSEHGIRSYVTATGVVTSAVTVISVTAAANSAGVGSVIALSAVTVNVTTTETPTVSLTSTTATTSSSAKAAVKAVVVAAS